MQLAVRAVLAVSYLDSLPMRLYQDGLLCIRSGLCWSNRFQELSSRRYSALEFEETQWAAGPVINDSFYNFPIDAADAAPVTVLKVEKDVDTSHFTIPPATALSRIIFQSKTLNGSLAPVSAFILWLYSPRNLIDGHPVVAWSYGTSRIAPNCAPSHYKNLWQHSLAPYQLVLQGFVVVAADYAGLGVGKDALGKPIVLEYLASSSHAHDVFYSVQAAQT